MTDHKSSRRQFVAGTGALLGGLALARSLPSAQKDSSKLAEVGQRTLGRTGVKVSELGIGCAPLQRQSVSVEGIDRLLHRALELGVTYLDVAPNYGNDETGFSEEKMGPTIKKIRERVFLVSKTEEPSYEGTWRLLRQSMKRLQTDHLDLVHLHNFGHEPRFPDLDLVLSEDGALGALQEARRKGVIRFIGASGHLHPSRFHVVLDTGEIDVLMNAVNPVAQHVYDFEHKVWTRAHHENLGLVAMKVLGGAGGGQAGFRLPEEMYDLAVRYALSIEGLSCAVIGMESIAELETAVATVTQAKPLSDAERYELTKRGLELTGQQNWKSPYGTPVG